MDVFGKDLPASKETVSSEKTEVKKEETTQKSKETKTPEG